MLIISQRLHLELLVIGKGFWRDANIQSIKKEILKQVEDSDMIKKLHRLKQNEVSILREKL